jgi:hypothetical protein
MLRDPTPTPQVQEKVDGSIASTLLRYRRSQRDGGGLSPLISDSKVTTEVRTLQTTTADLLRLSEWLAANDCTHVAMEATGVYWKPV